MSGISDVTAFVTKVPDEEITDSIIDKYKNKFVKINCVGSLICIL